MNKKIVLVGFMGAGKTSLGKLLARKLNYSLIDLDKFIVQQEQQAITDIFAEHGETYFRELEHKYFKMALKEYDIISTGGGIVEYNRNNYLLRRCHVIYLKVPFNIIYSRIKNDVRRPLVKQKTYYELKALYYDRDIKYSKVCNFHAYNHKNIKKTVQYIIQRLNLQPKNLKKGSNQSEQ